MRQDPQIDFEWGPTALPGPNISASIRHCMVWEGFIRLPAGSSSLRLRTDATDGVRVYIDDAPVLDSWTDSDAARPVTMSSPVSIGADGAAIRVEHYDRGGVDTLSLSSLTGEDPAVVPASWLSPAAFNPLPRGWSLCAGIGGAPRYMSAIIGSSGISLASPDGALHRYEVAGAPQTPSAVTGWKPPPGESASLGWVSDDAAGDQAPDQGTLVVADAGTTSTFDSTGHLRSELSGADNAAPASPRYRWGAAGQLEGIDDPVGARSMDFDYGPSCPAGGFGPAPAGTLCRVRYWDGTSTDLYYLAERLARVVNPGGEVTDLVYSDTSAGQGGPDNPDTMALSTLRDPLGSDAAGYGPYASSLQTQRLDGIDAATVAGSRSARSELMRLLAEHVSRRSQGRVLDVATSVELAAFEDPTFHDRLRGAHVASFRPLMLTTDLLTVVGNAIGMAALLVVLGVLHPILVPALLAACVPSVVIQARNSRLSYDFNFELTPSDRVRLYLMGVLCDKDAAKEVRAFTAAPFLRARYESLYAQRLVSLRRVTKARMGRALASVVVGSALLAGAFSLLLGLVVVQRLSFAAAMAAAIAMQQLGMRLQAMASSGANLLENALVLDDLESFTREPVPEPATATVPAIADLAVREVAVRHLSFRYPGCVPTVLSDVSLSIGRGEVVAIVGRNGSGKTTLAKLLANLYAPGPGQILWDGTDVTGLDRHAVGRQVSVIFQDFGRYCLSAHDNIAFGYDDEDRSGDVVAAARVGGCRRLHPRPARPLRDPLGTPVRGGHELSMGQWQRMAVARAIVRPCGLLILDEPSSVLDAEASTAGMQGQCPSNDAALVVGMCEHRRETAGPGRGRVSAAHVRNVGPSR